MKDFIEIWGYLNQEPLFWLTSTLCAYSAGDAAFRYFNRRPYVNPVMIAVSVLAILLWSTGTKYETYFEGAQFIHFLLGPATVALAMPLFQNITQVRRATLPILAALTAGSLTAILSALVIAYTFGIRDVALVSLLPKSATAPVAIGISDQLGGSPTLTAVLVIITGIIGAIIATPLLNALGIKDWRSWTGCRCGCSWYWHCKGFPSTPNCWCICWLRHGAKCYINSFYCTSNIKNIFMSTLIN